MMTGNIKIDHYVEVLCKHGCNAVYRYIELLQAGQELSECTDLDAQEREVLCQELKTIMSLYKQP